VTDDEKQKNDEAGEAQERKPRRRRAKKDEPAEAQAAAAEDAAEEEADDSAADEDEDEQAAEEQPAARRRGSAETSAPAERKAAPRRDDDGAVVVAAQAKYVRSAPRKARLVMRHIRGKPVADARAILDHAPRTVSTDILKLLNSAVANAESNYELDADELRVERAWVDEGPTIKRYRPRALGRATRINKRTSHMTIELTTTEEGK
jgi:ribosomal protein L22